MLVIGLTGGIGSGKSTVAELFAQRGVPVIDTDVIARELVEPGEPALAEIAAAFGEGLVDSEGRLDRARLRNLVFDDEAQRQRLEAILHPRIYARVRDRVAQLDAPYCVVVIPLLIETGGGALVDRILVVDAPLDVRIRRTQSRDGLPEEQVRTIAASQAGRERRLEAADDVIDNGLQPGTLDAQVEALHAKYLALAAEQPS